MNDWEQKFYDEFGDHDIVDGKYCLTYTEKPTVLGDGEVEWKPYGDSDCRCGWQKRFNAIVKFIKDLHDN